jgi:CRM1 C terminal
MILCVLCLYSLSSKCYVCIPLLLLLQDILAVMTDMLHKSCFKAHATLLRHMFHLTQMGQVTVQLWDDAQGQAAAAAGNANKHAHSLG